MSRRGKESLRHLSTPLLSVRLKTFLIKLRTATEIILGMVTVLMRRLDRTLSESIMGNRAESLIRNYLATLL